MPALKQALDQSYSRCEVKERKEKEGKIRIFLAMIKAILSVLLPVSLMIAGNEGLNFFLSFPPPCLALLKHDHVCMCVRAITYTFFRGKK